MNQLEQGLSLRNRAVATVTVGLLAMAPVVGVSAAETSPAKLAAPTTEPAETPEQCVDRLPINFLAGQVLMVGLQAQAMSNQAPTFRRYNVGGAVLMDSPTNPYGGSIKRFKLDGGSRGDQVLISTDEEGGEVQRFSSLGALPSPEQAAHSLTPGQAQKLVTKHGRKLKAVGVDMILGPLADVAPKHGSGPLGNRVFSSDPSVVSTYDRAYVRGWQAAGLLPTLKHFPGLGSATGNTDFQTAITPPLSSLKQRDFIPYKNLSKSDTAIMVGNPDVPGWSKGPASLSHTVDKYLRQTLGYKNNLVITDALNAAAITNIISEAHAVTDAIAAGNDMAMIVEASNDSATNARLIQQLESRLEWAVRRGDIPKQQLVESVLRKLGAQHIDPCKLG